MGDKELLEAIGRMLDERDERLSDMMDEKLETALDPIKKDIKDLKGGQKDLKAGQKNMIKRLAKIEAVQEYLIEHVDDLEQRSPA